MPRVTLDALAAPKKEKNRTNTGFSAVFSLSLTLPPPLPISCTMVRVFHEHVSGTDSVLLATDGVHGGVGASVS